jgi:hypothetical protein
VPNLTGHKPLYKPTNSHLFVVKPKKSRKESSEFHTHSALMREASAKEEIIKFLSSIATRRFSKRCIKDGNSDNELPISFEKPRIFIQHSSGGSSTKCSVASLASEYF